MWYWGSGGAHWWAWFLAALGMVVFWGLLIWAIVSLVRWNASSGTLGPGPQAETPEAVLKRRFAAGEIDEDEYRRRLDVLREHERVPTG